jgi:hypothetical protein
MMIAAGSLILKQHSVKEWNMQSVSSMATILPPLQIFLVMPQIYRTVRLIAEAA